VSLISGQCKAQLLRQFGVICGVDVIEDTATGHLDLRQAQIDGHRFRDVQESPVGTQGKSEAVQTLQYVRPLVLVEQLNVNVGRYRVVLLMLVQLHLVVRMLLVVLVVLVGSRTTVTFRRMFKSLR